MSYNKYMFKNSKKGFTLIELLVVISIMGVLSTIVVITYKNGKADARNKQRIVNFSQFGASLEDYYDEFESYVCGDGPVAILVNGKYYSIDSSGSAGFLNGRATEAAPGCQYPQGGSPAALYNQDGLYDTGYLSIDTPRDPLNTAPYTYWYATPIEGRGEYLMWTTLENNSADMISDGGTCNKIYEEYSDGWLSTHSQALAGILNWLGSVGGTCN
ncbi:MAG: type II secretion system protein [Patescibacteria group bacterium]